MVDGRYIYLIYFFFLPFRQQQQQQQQFDDPNAIYEDDLFGFRVRVRLLDREPCTLGVTCFEDEFEGELATRVDPFRDPEFNIVSGDPDSSTTTTGNTLSDAIQQAFFRRQTNEEFSSDAPPDCRTELNPSGCVAPNRRTSSFFSPGSLSFFKRLF